MDALASRISELYAANGGGAFTDGLMHPGRKLGGIAKVSTLEDREKKSKPSTGSSKQIVYWQARYPFPFLKEIKTWSQERRLNLLLVTALSVKSLI